MDTDRLQLQYWHGATSPDIVTVLDYACGSIHPCDRLYLAELNGNVLVGIAPIRFLNLSTFEAELDYGAFQKWVKLWPADYLLVLHEKDP